MKKGQNYVFIMAGGQGSRFWPLSTPKKPKQFIDILGTGETLLQGTYQRAKKLTKKDNIYIITHAGYKNLVNEQISDLNDGNILTEPSRNNTAPSIAYSLLKIKSKDPKGVIVFLPSDHLILKEEVLTNTLKKAFDFCANNKGLLTLGIKPTRPDIGYGYIETIFDENDAILPVNKFHEKPSKELAQKYIESGIYYWNSGVFVSSVTHLYDEFKRSAPEILDVLDKNVYNSPKESEFINENYAKTKSISFDFAIAEKAKIVYSIPCDCGWTDLGTWLSLYKILDKDKMENSSNYENTNFLNSHNNIVHLTGNKNVVIKDLNNYIIVDTDDSLLIYPINKEQEIKDDLEKI